jgi:hypothetical protein
MRRGARKALRAAGTLALVGVSVVLTVGLVELGARLFVPAWTPAHAERIFWRHDASLGWSHVRGVTARHRHRDFDVEVSINTHGLRDDPHPVARVPGVRRMLLLGDSFAFGYGVAHPEAIGERLERRLPGWEVLSAGVSGYGTDQALLWYRQELRRFRPDLVVLLFHPNDVADNNDDGRYGYNKPRFVLDEGALALRGVPVPRDPWTERVERWAYHRTWVLHRLWRLPHLLEASDVLAAPDEGPPPPPPLAVTEALLGALADRVRADGAHFAVLRLPMGPELAGPLGARLDALRVPQLDLARAFEGVPRRRFKFPHDGHWNAEGHRMAADAAQAFLAREGLLDGGAEGAARGSRGDDRVGP